VSVHRAGRGRHRAVVPLHTHILRTVARKRAARRAPETIVHQLVPPARPAPAPRRRGRRIGGMVTGFVGAAVLTAGAAYAIITATATGSHDVGTGTLSLTQTGNGAGLSTAVTNMMPNDVVNRYVAVQNAGTSDGQSLTLAITGATANKLVTDPTNGLKVTVTACPVAWNAAAGTCSGTTSTLLTQTAVSSMGSGAAKTLIAGTFSSGAYAYLQVSLALPDQVENTANGTPPAGTIQGLTNTLTYTFQMTQRNGTTTNS
jgi:hypothetical protein